MPSYPKNYPFYSWMPKPVGYYHSVIFLSADSYGRRGLFGE